MESRSTRARLAASFAVTVELALLTLCSALATADAGNFTTPVRLDIPAQRLASALTVLADQADLQMLFSQDLVTGLQSPGLYGNYSAWQALERMLVGVNLEFVVTGRDTVVIRERDGADAQTKAALK